ncbi:hypothetical protein MTsPCn9_30330 [Croceitalea sp. MTPC9]|uniref:hypothetical protein n=1 Tax=unclassified Croceitalea TaxID=2632280 RepID=UPI002B3C1DE0|nr:hypothetical protein MTsPCn6_21320 [Croceitalea sp. MTPC6]GMN18093.1 hypothetical protein MTsPCn9_30330 [Croceitalea sp. MTPC9]
MSQELIDFLGQNYFVLVYAITLVIAIFYYRKYFDTELKYFPLIIAYTFFNELLGYFIRYTDGFAFFPEKEYLNANDIIYNIYSLIFFGFFYHVYWKLFKTNKRWILYGSIIILLSFIISCFYQNPFLQSLYYSIALGSLFLFVLVVFYLIGAKQSLKWSLQKYNLMFWVSIGLGIFYLFFPTIYLIGFKNYELWQKLELRNVLKILIVLMYSLFSIGFIVSKRKVFH